MNVETRAAAKLQELAELVDTVVEQRKSLAVYTADGEMIAHYGWQVGTEFLLDRAVHHAKRARTLKVCVYSPGETVAAVAPASQQD